MKPSIDGYRKSQASQQSTVPTPPPPPSVGGASFIALPTAAATAPAFLDVSPYRNTSKMKMINLKKKK